MADKKSNPTNPSNPIHPGKTNDSNPFPRDRGHEKSIKNDRSGRYDQPTVKDTLPPPDPDRKNK